MNKIHRGILRKVRNILQQVIYILTKKIDQNSNFTPYILSYIPNTTNKKIIHFNGNFEVGGSSQLIVDIIENTSDKWFHKIVVPYIKYPIPYQPVELYVYPIGNLQGIYDFLVKEKPDLVHIHYWVRIIHKYHEFALWYNTIFQICEDLSIGVIQNVNVPTSPHLNSCVLENVFVSKFVVDNFNNSPTKATIIYPGSNFTHFSNEEITSLPQNTIGMVYRLDTDKLNDQSIEVFIEVVKKRPSTKCYIIGNGHYYEYYNKRVNDEGQQNNFIFTGYVSYKDLPDLYKKFGIFVAPVHDESFGQVTPFAMSMGLAVAGYDTGALSEILGTKETLSPYGDIAALANIISSLIDNPDYRLKLGKTNQIRAHSLFSVQTMINSYNNLYTNYISD